ncbi:hypothetical protein [Calothrix sp. UHCC 0171]|uniref:hypothetical protein n=1 Tax=Calothrix sp. UHCC 0171 TaxID=3110245 RepID=UPI002B1F194A|nr:hypothetical protein [Calothrix sp. UHCC 0171]MEA5572478.1 hypothetical protein [Calothrix sp. UHCC 0171]
MPKVAHTPARNCLTLRLYDNIQFLISKLKYHQLSHAIAKKASLGIGKDGKYFISKDNFSSHSLMVSEI